MTPEQFQQRLQKLMTDLPMKVDEQIATEGENLQALIVRRINLKGVNAFGRSFPPYTDAYQKFKSGAYRVQSSKKTLKSGKLSKGKKRPNKDVGFRNLSYSGSMLENLGVFKEGDDYILGWQDAKELKKAEGNSEYTDGINIIKASESEIKQITEAFNKAIEKFINQTLGT